MSAALGPAAEPEVAAVVSSSHVVSVARVVRRVLHGGIDLNANVTPGVEAPARIWAFAEGYAGLTYHEYRSLFNPGARAARVTVHFAPQGQGTRPSHGVAVPPPVALVVGPHGQAVLDVRAAYQRYPVKSLGLLVASTAPVVTLRTLYWGAGVQTSQFGADAKPGSAAASRVWYFTGLSVAGGNQPFLTVVAPTRTARVTVRVYAPAGRLLATLPLRVPGGERATIKLYERVHGVAGPLQAMALSGVPVVAEAPQYNAGSPNLARHAGDVITGVSGGTTYAHLPYLNTGRHAVAPQNTRAASLSIGVGVYLPIFQVHVIGGSLTPTESQWFLGALMP